MLRNPSPFALALPAGLLVAAMLGVQLGESAIAEINPVHFQGAASPPRGIDPVAAVATEPSFAQAYGWEDGQAARAQLCGGDCDARRARDAMAFALDATVRARPASQPLWRDATPVTEPKPWPAGETGERALSVQHYLHYPIEEEQVEEAISPPAEDEPGADE
jgi:hypothetical protein